jgi:hypothetical protein
VGCAVRTVHHLPSGSRPALAGYPDGRIRTVGSCSGYWNPEPELIIRSGCRTGSENRFILRIAFEPRSFYLGTFSDCHKTGTDASSSLSLDSGSFIWPFRVFIVYRLFTLSPFHLFSSSFHNFSLPFSFFAPWSC